MLFAQAPRRSRWLVWSVPCLALAAASAAPRGHGPQPDYNILFIILDDVGADQFQLTNPGGLTLPSTPTINALASQGVRFTDCWAMPECSPSRVSFFTGRFPGRTGVGSPLTQTTLAQSQCSPFEITAPRLLQQAGYASALYGKFHLAQNEYNPFGIAAPASVGFTRFNGTLLGAPPYIDPTIAGQVTDGSNDGLSCGFPVENGAPAICACAFPDGGCEERIDALECLVRGGIPLVASDGTPITECDSSAIARIDWSATSGNYAWPRTINEGDQATQIIPARVHADRDQAELAIGFIQAQQSAGHRWMCSLSFSGDHDPWQPPPPSSLPPGTSWPQGLPLLCEPEDNAPNATLQQRLLSNRTIESMDTQIRRVLLESGLASITDGAFQLNAPDTAIVVVGDNGSFLTTVKAPFNPLRAKATAYQSGVSVPLVVAGGPVVQPGRSVNHMVNIVDLFQLFAELAGLDAHASLPPGRPLDSRSMIPYLRNPAAPAQRAFNFTQYSEPYQATPCYPCLISTGGAATCTDSILTTEQLCESQGGVWYGPGRDGSPATATDCCDLWKQLGDPSGFAFVYPAQWAISDGRWKLVHNQLESCGTAAGAAEYEFYDLSACFAANALFGHGIDNPEFDLLDTGTPLTPVQQAAYDQLLAASTALVNSMEPCVGDVDMNGIVAGGDLSAMLAFWGVASVADLNNDGITSGPDLSILLANWGPCHGD